MKVAVDLTTKVIIDLLPDEATDSSPYLINNGYILLDIENPILNHIENEDGTITSNFRDLTKAELSPYELSKINTDYENAVSQLTSSVPNSEISTWTKQENEARSWLVDNTVLTPLIDAICSSRGCEKSYLVNKIIQKADAYANAIGLLVGDRQKQEKLILD